MMWIQRPKLALLGAGLLLALCLLMLSVSLQTGQAALLHQGSPTTATLTTTTPVVPLSASSTPTVALSPVPTFTQTAVPSAAPLGYDQALATYREIATEVMKSAERVLDIAKWSVAAIFSLVGVAGGAILYIVRTAGQASDSAARSAQAAEESKARLEKMETQIQEAIAQFRAYWETTDRLKTELKELQLLRRDVTQTLPRLETLASIDTYAVRLLSADREISRVAKRTLIEFSKDKDPVVRRECVRVFGMIPDYPECFVDLQDPLIISRLQQMALEDPERGVQLEARLALKKFGVDLGDE